MVISRIILCLTIFVIGALAGSECPPRAQIYPCMCLTMNLTRKKLHTTVICRGLRNTENFDYFLPTLQNMEIDKFLLYDSLWDTDNSGPLSESQRSLPSDWLTLMKIKEIEIHDTSLSECFACQWTKICRNTVTTGFKVVNSTSTDKFCSFCNTENGERAPWLSCMTNLEEFQLTRGNLRTITTDFFPLALRKLKILNLSNNRIVKIDSNTFKNLPNLKSLDLSHNSIEHIDHTFGTGTELEYIDLNHNHIKVIGSTLIPLMPKIKSLNFAYNDISDFKLADWRRAPDTLRNIDLTGNPIRCDCSLSWVNTTFPVHVAIPGSCTTPDEYIGSKIRPTSRHMIERCDASGNLGSRRNNKKRN